MRVPPSADVAAIVEQLINSHPSVSRLKTLDLSDCAVNDDMVFELRVLRSLAVLNLSGTNITRRALGIVHWLPALQYVNTAGTKVGWWPRWKAERFLKRRVRKSGAIDEAVHPVNTR